AHRPRPAPPPRRTAPARLPISRDRPTFLDAVAQRVSHALQRLPSSGATQVLFTAHSLPERILSSGDPYAAELRASAAAVAQRARLGAWHFAFQSAGATPEPWLGPEAGG